MLWYSITRVQEAPGLLVTNLARVPCLCSSTCCNSGPCSHQQLRIVPLLRMLSLMLIQILSHSEWHISLACVAFLSQSHSWSLLTLFQGFTLLVTTPKTGSKVDSPQVAPNLVGETEGNTGGVGGYRRPTWPNLRVQETISQMKWMEGWQTDEAQEIARTHILRV